MSKVKTLKIGMIVLLLMLISLSGAWAEINAKGTLNKAEYPWVGELYAANSSEASECTAVFIGEQWVLTAAHCMEGKDSFEIKFGGNFSAGGRITKVDYYVIHSKYDNKKNSNDIALLHITEKLPYYHVELPPNNDYELLSKPMFSIGLGLNENKEYTGELNYTIQNLTFYLNKFSSKIPAIYYDKASKKYSLPCSGDSGGPLVASGKKAILLGITSYGAENCAPSSPAFYTRVSVYLKWIEDSKTNINNTLKKKVKTNFEKIRTPKLIVQNSNIGLLAYFTPNNLTNYYSIRCIADNGSSYIFNSRNNYILLRFPETVPTVSCHGLYIDAKENESIPTEHVVIKLK